MYYVDMLGKFDKAARGSVTAAPFVSAEGTIPGGAYYKDGVIYAGDSGNAEDNLFRIRGGYSEPDSEQFFRKDLTYNSVKDTDENPILVIKCSSIQLFIGSEVFIKFLYCGSNYMVAALIYGSCEFDGVALQRCSDENLNSLKKGRVITPSVLGEYGGMYCVDKTSGYSYLDECVFSMIISEKMDKSGSITFKAVSIKKEELIFNKEPRDAAMRKYLEEKKAKEERERARAEKLAKEREESERRRKEREAQKEAELKEKQSKVRLTSDFEEKASCNAADFLAIVASLGKK